MSVAKTQGQEEGAARAQLFTLLCAPVDETAASRKVETFVTVRYSHCLIHHSTKYEYTKMTSATENAEILSLIFSICFFFDIYGLVYTFGEMTNLAVSFQ